MKLAVIGGSGLYQIPGLVNVAELECATPYGSPSERVLAGRLGDTELLFLPRHGRGHRLAPHEVNYRANICALKQLGATHLLSVSAVGSMLEGIAPGDVVVPDQFIDLSKGRPSTFFGDGVVAHVSFAEPVCPLLAAAAAAAAARTGLRVHEGGTYVCMEGPQFSTRAESRLYRSWEASVIGMTAMPEAKLAREAELPYALLAFATDYDCWHESEEAVSVEAVLSVLRQNASHAQSCVAELATRLPDPAASPATGALATAIITARTEISDARKAQLDWLVKL